MLEVEEVILCNQPRTRVWFSPSVQRAVGNFRKTGDPNGRFWKKLKHISSAGFDVYIGRDSIVRPEGDGIYRLGIMGSLFRIVGFFENDRFDNFIAIEAFLKKGQSLNAADRERIKLAAWVRKSGAWRKNDGRYPRLAE